VKSPRTGGVELSTLLELFPDEALLAHYEFVPPEQVPDPYGSLLVHPDHMTVTMEQFHGERVAVQILQRVRHGESYARMILLSLENSGRIVQFGIMRFDLRFCDDAVRDEILRGVTPLGRILIEHNVLRYIQPAGYLKIVPGASLMKYLGLEQPADVYGRIANIFCNGEPAVDLLEVAAPVA
jgi:chorismate-pyruvate lyase